MTLPIRLNIDQNVGGRQVSSNCVPDVPTMVLSGSLGMRGTNGRDDPKVAYDQDTLGVGEGGFHHHYVAPLAMRSTITITTGSS